MARNTPHPTAPTEPLVALKPHAPRAWTLGFPRWRQPGAWRVDAPLALVHILFAFYVVTRQTPGTDAAWTGFPLDDSWIHLVYARSLAAFEGFAYNPGQQETGFTSPLWVMLEAPLFWIKWLWGGSIVAGVKMLGVLVAWVTTGIAWRWIERLTGSRWAGVAVALALALDPHLSFARVSGMEVWLCVATALAILWSLSERRMAGVGIALALAPLARPENGVIWAAGLLIAAFALIAHRLPWRAWLLAFVPTIATLGGWAAFCLAVTDRPLPSTFYAKSVKRDALWNAENSLQLAEIVKTQPWMHYYVELGLFALGAVALIALWRRPRKPARHDWDGLLVRIAAVTYPGVFLFALSHTHAFVQTWPFYWHRYAEPALAVLLIPAAVGVGLSVQLVVAALVRLWRTRKANAPHGLRLRHGVALVVAALALTATTVSLTRLPRFHRTLSARFANNAENINEMNVSAGIWARDNLEPGTWIAVHDAGAIRFWSDLPTLDMVGLNNHQVIKHGHHKLMRELKPTHIFVFNGWYDRSYKKSTWHEVVHATTAKNYTICDCGAQHTAYTIRRKTQQEVRDTILDKRLKRRQTNSRALKAGRSIKRRATRRIRAIKRHMRPKTPPALKLKPDAAPPKSP